MFTLGSGRISVARWYEGSRVGTPATITATGNGTGGSNAAGTYYVRVSARNAYGDGTPTASTAVTITTGQGIKVDWTAPASGATPTHYDIYIGTVAGEESRQAAVAAPTVTYTRTAAIVEGQKRAVITAVSGSGTTVTYTADNNFTAGQLVSISQVIPAAYNLQNVTIATASSTQFTVTNAATGSYESGGLAEVGKSARYVGLIDLGEIGGDVEYDINYQEREFLGQYNFPISKQFFGGKSEIRVRRVEMDMLNLNLVQQGGYQYDSANAIHSLDPLPNNGLLRKGQPLYIQLTHTRSDDTDKTVTIVSPKAYLINFTVPFTREDIAVMDLDFMLTYDSTKPSGQLVLISGS